MRRHLVRYISTGFRKRSVNERHFLLHTVYLFAIAHTLQVVILRTHKGLFVNVGNNLCSIFIRLNLTNVKKKTSLKL